MADGLYDYAERLHLPDSARGHLRLKMSIPEGVSRAELDSILRAGARGVERMVEAARVSPDSQVP